MDGFDHDYQYKDAKGNYRTDRLQIKPASNNQMQHISRNTAQQISQKMSQTERRIDMSCYLGSIRESGMGKRKENEGLKAVQPIIH